MTSAQNSKNKNYIQKTPELTARALLDCILAAVNSETNREFSIALSGGTTPAVLFNLWREEYLLRTPWNRLSFYWVDERCVPPDDVQSNFGLTNRLLLSHLPPDTVRFYRIQGEAAPQKEALRYSQLVQNQLQAKTNVPLFDFVLLGIGDDGHTSSIFPGLEPLLTCPEPYSLAVHPHNGSTRICMTGRPLTAAQNTFFLVTGNAKQDITHRILQKENATLYPASWVWHNANNPQLFASF